MLVRIAQLSDLETITAIYNQAILAGHRTADTQPFKAEERLDWFNAHSPKHYPLLVAIDENDTVIGYLTISPYREGRKAFLRTAEISYYIHFEHHRKGVASCLMDDALKRCPELNIKTLIAMLLATNKGSIGFLKKHGFSEWGRMPKIAEFGIVAGNVTTTANTTVDHLFYGKRLS